MQWRYQIDLGFTRWAENARGEGRKYDLRGSCVSCGACCETPMIYLNRWLYHTRSIRRLVVWWHRTVNGFELVGWDREAQAMIFRCTHLDPVTKLCDSYESRPGMCRDYPMNLAEAPNPQFLEGCSLYAYARNAEAIRASLDDLELTPERRLELEKKFYIHEPAPLPPNPHLPAGDEARGSFTDRPPTPQT